MPPLAACPRGRRGGGGVKPNQFDLEDCPSERRLSNQISGFVDKFNLAGDIKIIA